MEEFKSLGINLTNPIHKSYAASCKHPTKLRSIARKSSSQSSSSAQSVRSKFFEFLSQEEVERQERCALEAAWKLAKDILKHKEKDEASFFSLANEWCLPAPSGRKPEEREFVVDSGALQNWKP